MSVLSVTGRGTSWDTSGVSSSVRAVTGAGKGSFPDALYIDDTIIVKFMAVISGKPKKTLQLWIDACLNDGIGLEEWEKRLLHDARGQLAATGTLSGYVLV